jgi:hypothetical protein
MRRDRMTRKMSALISCIALSFLWSSATGLGVVREFQGSSSTTTAEFVVRAPWLLDWRVNGEYANVLGLDIDLLDVKTGRHAGRVLKTKRVGNGVKLFNEGGRFKLRIDASHARWQIKVEEISKEDAELYTPRGDD